MECILPFLFTFTFSAVAEFDAHQGDVQQGDVQQEQSRISFLEQNVHFLLNQVQHF